MNTGRRSRRSERQIAFRVANRPFRPFPPTRTVGPSGVSGRPIARSWIMRRSRDQRVRSVVPESRPDQPGAEPPPVPSIRCSMKNGADRAASARAHRFEMESPVGTVGPRAPASPENAIPIMAEKDSTKQATGRRSGGGCGEGCPGRGRSAETTAGQRAGQACDGSGVLSRGDTQCDVQYRRAPGARRAEAAAAVRLPLDGLRRRLRGALTADLIRKGEVRSVEARLAPAA